MEWTLLKAGKQGQTEGVWENVDTKFDDVPSAPKLALQLAAQLL